MKATILVVDDERDVREFLQELLEDNGYAVHVAEDGRQGYAAVEQVQPHLILLDLLMPGETGTGLYRKLHTSKLYSKIPVIVISGLAGRHVAVNKSVPVFDKPIDPDGLLAAIAGLLPKEGGD